MARSRRSLLAFAASCLVLAGVVVASLVRIPDDRVGVSSSGALGPGWRVVLPWARPALVPRTGAIVLAEVPLRTREGSTLRFEVASDYEIDSRLAPDLGARIRTLGLAGALSERAASAFERAARERDAEALLADRTILEGAVAAELAPLGVRLARVRAHSTIQDEIVRRRRTEEARALRRGTSGRVLVIGLDGADWNLIGPLVGAGRMPNMARLLREGAWGPLRSYDPMYSPLLWTTIATGKAPDKHGIADFLVQDARLGARRPISSDFRKVKALWNVLSDFEVSSAWIAWWATYPAEPVHGVLVTELVAHSVVRSGGAAPDRPGLTSPPDLLRDRAALLVPPAAVDRREVLRLFPVEPQEFAAAQARAGIEEPNTDSKAPPDPLVHTIKLLGAMRTYHNLALDQIRRGLPFVAVYYEGIDMMGHRFQHCLPPRMPLAADEEFARFGDAVPGYHEIQDEMIGELVREAGPGTTTVIVSDHGFAVGDDRPDDIVPYTTGQPAEWHRPWGIWLVHGPGVPPGPAGPASLYDIAPTLLHLAGLPTAEDMPGVVLPAVLRSAQERPASIRSYELVGAALDHGEAPEIDAEAMAEMVANLKALGYVGGVESLGSGAAGLADDTGAASTQVFYHRNLATYLIKQGQFAEAERELHRANERQPFPKTYSMLSEVRASQGRLEDAAAALEEGWAALPDQMDPHTALWIVELHLRRGDRRAAEAAAARRSSELPAAVRAAIEGRLIDAAGQSDVAIPLYERALGEDPLLVQTLLRLLALRRERGEAHLVEPILVAGLAREPRSDLYHSLLGQILRDRGDTRSALEHFRRASELVPDDPSYLAQVAVTAATLGRNDEALAAIAWARRVGSSDAQVWLGLGSALDRIGRPLEALDSLDRAATLAPDDPRPTVATALVLAKSGRLPEARETLARARARFPESEAVRTLSERLK